MGENKIEIHYEPCSMKYKCTLTVNFTIDPMDYSPDGSKMMVNLDEASDGGIYLGVDNLIDYKYVFLLDMAIKEMEREIKRHRQIKN